MDPAPTMTMDFFWFTKFAGQIHSCGLDGYFHCPAINIPRGTPPETVIVGNEQFIVLRGFDHGRVVRGRDTGGQAHDVAPGFALIAAHGEIVPVPGMLTMRPAGFL